MEERKTENFETKDSIISEIRNFHPGQRPEKYEHYGWYQGGMADTGGWHFEVMFRDTIEHLQDCLDLLHNPNRDVDPDLLEMRAIEAKADTERNLTMTLGGIIRSNVERELLFPEQYRLEQFKKNKSRSIL